MKKIIAVSGGADCDEKAFKAAWRVGELLGQGGCDVITGGLTGVMEGASAGASDQGAMVIGVLPGADPAAANPHVQAVVATGMGDARNAIIANTAVGFVAIGGAESGAYSIHTGEADDHDTEPKYHRQSRVAGLLEAAEGYGKADGLGFA